MTNPTLTTLVRDLSKAPNVIPKSQLEEALEFAYELGAREAKSKDILFYVGYHKGEMDFGVRGDVADLCYEEMRQLREMIVVAIGTMEDMWQRAQEPLTHQSN